MVDALRSAWRVLRPRGLVVDLQPAAVTTVRLAIVHDGVRREIGTISTGHDTVDAAHRARRRAVAEGWFTRVALINGVYPSHYRGLPDLRWLLRQNADWHLERSVQRRLEAAWARRRRGAMIEIRRSYSVAVLRKRNRA